MLTKLRHACVYSRNSKNKWLKEVLDLFYLYEDFDYPLFSAAAL